MIATEEDENKTSEHKPEDKIQNTNWQIRLPLLIFLSLGVGIWLGAMLFGGIRSQSAQANYQKIKEILGYIDQEYVDTVKIDELVDFSIEQLLEKLDPHTSYIAAKNIQLAHSQLEGDFEGVGIEFNIVRDTVHIAAIIPGGPSEKEGLQAGDKIIKVDDKNIASIKIDNAQIFKLLRGKKGTKVKLSVLRKGKKQLMHYTVTRNTITSPSVEVSFMVDAQTGFIKITRFASNTYKEFREALEKLQAQGMQRLIIDLRDNPGGYMDRAINIADELLAGSVKIVYTDGKGSKYDSEHKAHIQGMMEKGAVIVLINEGSASASEILAGALQDNDRALIVGRRSFGKGLVQMPIALSDGSELRLTISRYYTPSGRSIQKPFTKDKKDAYENEILERYKRGEYFSADSIKFDKSLQYTTAKGRKVYGGGGIMPDVFVSFDSSAIQRYLNDLYRDDIIREVALSYYATYKAELANMKYENFKTNFNLPKVWIEEVLKRAQQGKIATNGLTSSELEKDIQIHLKAWIARSVWQSRGFYPIWFEQDEIFQKALKLFDKAEKLLL
ncbi:MAG: S41 family peptidase [Cytophagales bacterium]|nr:MAG: S41 family peptidase [Cytophagales bacterium]